MTQKELHTPTGTYLIIQHLDSDPILYFYRGSQRIHAEKVDFYDLDPKTQNELINLIARRG